MESHGDRRGTHRYGHSDSGAAAMAAATGDAAGARSAVPVAPGSVSTPATTHARDQPAHAPSRSASEHAHAAAAAGAPQSPADSAAAAAAALPLHSHRPDADGHGGPSGSLPHTLPPPLTLPAELVGAPAAPLLIFGQPQGYSTAAALSARANALRTRLQSAGEAVALQNSIDVARRHGANGDPGLDGSVGSDGKLGCSAAAGCPGEAGAPGQRGADG